MIKVYVMESCPDCSQVKEQLKDNPNYEMIDIGAQSRNLKEFLALRDHHPAFDRVKERGNIGIPCFIEENGTIVFGSRHHIITSVPGAGKTDAAVQDVPDGAACSLDGTGC